ncbi:MAG: hypothetical protein ABFD08_10440, partial [Syntrophomonas sp.]
MFKINDQFIAHVHKNADGAWAQPHKLSDHLEGTARLAETFASKFNFLVVGSSSKVILLIEQNEG